MPLRPAPFSLFLLPLIPFVALTVITLTLEPYCRPSFALPPTNPHTCQTYQLLAVILNAMIAVGLVFVGLVFWSRRKVEQDLESLRYSIRSEVDRFVGSSERTPLIPGAYTFGVREMPFLSDYGTVMGGDPAVSALLNFYHFPSEDGLVWTGSRYSDSDSNTSLVTAGSSVDEPVSPDAMNGSAACPFEGGDGWTRWRWRQSCAELSESPTEYTMVVDI